MSRSEKGPSKPLKDVDSVAQILFLNTLFRIAAVCLILGFFAGLFAGGLLGALIGMVLGGLSSVPISWFLTWGVDRSSGGVAAAFYGGKRRPKTQRQLLTNEMGMVRHDKMQKNFDEALDKINSILKRDPDFPDALLLKAQILWEGFGNVPGAMGYLRKIIREEDDQTSIYRWASSLYDELDGIEGRE
ncbi:MAG: tetratricopeptide repeat protein [Desulfobacterales bacterium]